MNQPGADNDATSGEAPNFRDRVTGSLLGTALGDALGLPAEGMSREAIARRFGRIDRFRLLGRTGYVSDDTEQAALVAQALVLHPDDAAACAREFRRLLVRWLLRLPWGVGLATLRAGIRGLLRLQRSGVPSAGDGAAMRAAVIGLFFRDRPDDRRLFGVALAEVTHLDQRAIEAALYAAEIAAGCARVRPDADREELILGAESLLTHPELSNAVKQARELAAAGAETDAAISTCGVTGYSVHAIAFATYCFLRYGGDPLECLTEIAGAGGDTDTIGAIAGGWLGALHGDAGLPQELIGRIHDGPFGPTHLRALAASLDDLRRGLPAKPPRFSEGAALARNLALYPVILAHGFRRLIRR